MPKVYIRHKVSIGEIHNLSDKESGVLISENAVELEDPVQVTSTNGIYLAKVVFIGDYTIEVEIIEEIEQEAKDHGDLVLMQSVLQLSKMEFCIEKASEIGYSSVHPVNSFFSEYTLVKSRALYNKWRAAARQSQLQSLRPNVLQIHKPENIDEIDLSEYKSYVKLCMTTENVDRVSLSDYLHPKKDFMNSNFLIAVGPPKGWQSDDLELLQEKGFAFITLGETIMRSETVGVVAASALKFFQNNL